MERCHDPEEILPSVEHQESDEPGCQEGHRVGSARFRDKGSASNYSNLGGNPEIPPDDDEQEKPKTAAADLPRT